MKACRFQEHCQRKSTCPYLHSSTTSLSESQPMLTKPNAGTKSTCRFFSMGNCSKGDACQFLHIQVPCKLYLDGNCPFGSKCRYFHDVGNKTMDPIVFHKADSSTNQFHVVGWTKVTIGNGIKIIDIVFDRDSIPVSIRNIPPSLSAEDLMKLMSQFGHDSAQSVFDSLNGTLINPDNLEDLPLIVSIEKKAKKDVLDSAIKLSWYKPTVSAHVMVNGNSRDLVNIINGYRCGGRVLSCKMKPSGALFISNLHEGTTWNSLAMTFKSLNIHKRIAHESKTNNIHPPPFCSENVKPVLDKFLSRFGNVLSFDIKPSDSNSLQDKAIVIFERNEEAALAYDYFNNHKVFELGQTKIFAATLFTTKMSMLNAAYLYSKTEIENCSNLFPLVNISITQSGPSYLTVLQIKSNNAESLNQCMARLTSIANGTLIPLTWKSCLLNKEWTIILNRIGKNLGCFIYRDSRRKRLSFFGTIELDTVLTSIHDAMVDYENRKNIGIIKLDRDQIKKVLVYGIKNLTELCAATSISLDIIACNIKVNGPDTSKMFVKTWIQQTDSNSMTDSFHTLNISNEFICNVCFCPYALTDVVLLPECMHAYCIDCLQNYLKHCTTSGEFPIKCVSVNCTLLLNITTITNALADSEFQDLIRSSFDDYVSRNGDKYQFCPTPDCPQVYKLESGQVNCDICDSSICTSCKTLSHHGISCVEYSKIKDDPVEEAFVRWKASTDDVKDCPQPGCGATIEKNGGCNHITCHQCKSHICWVCTTIFPSESIYQHMREDHGGIETNDSKGIYRISEIFLDDNPILNPR
ncbi:hypothetical protein HDV02_000708 [Globomyces sp. JEL0801]|nr:hypothetical protein HDV02_000708 [Globomyces sp. JEL0801]